MLDGTERLERLATMPQPAAGGSGRILAALAAWRAGVEVPVARVAALVLVDCAACPGDLKTD